MTLRVSPTPRQLDVLRFIAGYLEAHGGVSPSYMDIIRGCGLPSKSCVFRILKRLEERGCIRRMPGKQRAIEVLARVTIPRGPAGEPLHFVCSAAWGNA